MGSPGFAALNDRHSSRGRSVPVWGRLAVTYNRKQQGTVRFLLAMTRRRPDILALVRSSLIAFRDSIDGDIDMEDDSQDRCEALDDQLDTPASNATFLPADPDDAEDCDPAEDNDDAESESWSEPRWQVAS